MTNLPTQDPDPVLARARDGRITMDERGARTPRVAIEILREAVATHNLLVDLYEWALDACEQGGGGGPFGLDVAWHSFISTWEDADELLPRVRVAIGRADMP